MKGWITLLAVFICATTTAQTENLADYKRVSYGIYLNTNLNYRWLNEVPEENQLQSLMNENDRTGFGYRFGINFNCELKPPFALQFGLLYGDRSYRTKETVLDFSSTPSSGNLPKLAYLSYHFNYFDIPIKLKYQFSPKNKVSFFIAGGITTSLFITHVQKLHVETDGQWRSTKDTQSIYGYDALNFFGEIDAGIDYRINRKLKLQFSANFQQALKAVNSNLLTKRYLYSGGLAIGVFFTPLTKEAVNL